MENNQESQSQFKHILNFTLMFLACLLGSVAIFMFAVGLETGHKVVTWVMKSLLENVMIVFGVFVIFNGLLFLMYWNKKKG